MSIQEFSRSPAGYPLKGPDGRPVEVPVRADLATDPYPSLADPRAFRAYFEREGFIVVRDAIPRAVCDQVNRAYEAEVKPDKGYFIRHQSGKPERHVFTDHGHMLYPIMNVHDLPHRKFPRFRSHSLDALTHPTIQRVLEVLFGEPGRLVHTMFFDGNQVTWAHQDSFYVDSTEIGRGLGIWVAMEDIHPGAGRFFVYPRSHRLAFPDDRLDPNGPNYKATVVRQIREHKLMLHAPALRQGDLIVWSTLTIHGSLESPEPENSRRCLTTHAIPRSHTVLSMRTRTPDWKPQTVNGIPLHFHRDQNRWRQRLNFLLEAHAPAVHQAMRQVRRPGPKR